MSFISLAIFQSSGLGHFSSILQLFLYQHLELYKRLDDLVERVFNCEALVYIFGIEGLIFHSEPLFLVQIFAFIP